jgi:hypothetical protein
VRRLLVRAYGERGLATSFELAGREQPQKTVGVVDPVVTYNEATPLNCDAIEPGLAQAITQAPSRVQRWMLAPPREPPPVADQRPTGDAATVCLLAGYSALY